MSKLTAIMSAAVLLWGGLAGSPAQQSGAGDRALAAALQPSWTELPWPFPMDQWGKGKAFQCKAADCGAEVTVYIRAKIGFCNCATGVADDEELDRISDFDLMGNQLTALGPGQPITVAWMKGRSRAFSVGGAQQAGRSAVQRSLRRDRRDGSGGAGSPGRNRGGRARIPQQPSGGALGRGDARPVASSLIDRCR
jgi:hypothetical protein